MWQLYTEFITVANTSAHSYAAFMSHCATQLTSPGQQLRPLSLWVFMSHSELGFMSHSEFKNILLFFCDEVLIVYGTPGCKVTHIGSEGSCLKHLVHCTAETMKNIHILQL